MLSTAREAYLLLDSSQVDAHKQFKRRLREIPWGLMLPDSETVGIRVESIESRLFHEGSLQEIAYKALEIPKTRQSNFGDGSQKILIHLKENRLEVYIGLSGVPLYKRGYKGPSSLRAPLPEHLARSIASELFHRFSPPQKPIVYNPFAGSGSLGFEALLEMTRAPGGLWPRDYSFSSWAGRPQSSIEYYRKTLGHQIDQNGPHHSACIFLDQSGVMIAELKDRWPRFLAPLPPSWASSLVEFHCDDFFSFRFDEIQSKQPLVLFMNPPYDWRLKIAGGARNFYREVGRTVSRLRNPYISGVILCPSEDSWGEFLRELVGFSTETQHFSHGGRDLRAVYFCRIG